MMTLYSTSFASRLVVMIAVIAVINFEAQSQGNTSNQTFSQNVTIDGHEGRFTCVNSNLTFDIDDVCDGQNQCPYSDDEFMCDNEYCSLAEYSCGFENSYECIPLHYVCDGYPDCEQNGIDEILCDPLDCVPSCQCSAYSVSCEGPNIVDDTNIRKSTRDLCFSGEWINGTKMPLSMPFNVTTYPLLIKLTISNTGLRELLQADFGTLTELICIDLTENQISNIDIGAFKGLHTLNEIALSSNAIRELRKGMFDDQSNLTYLYMDENSISSLPPGAFRGLDSIIGISLTNNRISNIDIDAFKGLHTLKYIDLSNNAIRVLRKGMFDDQSNLISLSLTNNRISNIDIDAFKGLHTLKYIDLSNNAIRVLRKGMFDDQSNLISLTFSYNPLEIIEPGTFLNLSQLEYLNTLFVKLASLKPDTFKGITSLKLLSTDDYRLCCLFDETDLCNIASLNFLDSCTRLMPNTILRIAMWVIGWGSLVGNTIVLVLRCRPDHSVSAKTQGLFIFNLAIADFLMGVYMIIISSADVYYGEYYYLFAEQWRGSFTCKVAGFINVLSSETSVFTLAIITVDRVLNVVFPFGKLKFRATSARVGVALIWTIAVLVSIVPLIVSYYINGFYGLSDVCVGLPRNFESRDTGETGGLVHNYETGLWEKPQYDTTSKRQSWVYSIAALFLGVNFLIFILILLTYVVIFVNVRKSARSVANPAGGSGSIDRAREVKLATRMAIIVLTDCFCWMPVFIMGILFQTDAVPLPVSLYAWSVVFILPINASINPYIYTFIAICDGSKTRST